MAGLSQGDCSLFICLILPHLMHDIAISDDKLVLDEVFPSVISIKPKYSISLKRAEKLQLMLVDKQQF
jgi:hypothetical protein